MKINLKKFISLTVILSLAFLLYPIYPPVVNAAGLTNVKDTMSTLKQSNGTTVFSDHEIIFTTNDGVDSGETIIITVPSDFLGDTDGDGALDETDVAMWIDTADGVCADAGGQTLVASSPSTSEWQAVFSDTHKEILTLTSGGASAVVTTGQEVCVQIGENAGSTSQYENPTSTGEKTITLAVGGTDTGLIPVYIVDNDTVVTTATVLASLTFDVTGDFTMEFGTIPTGGSRWATTSGGSGTTATAHTLTASTNSTSGYTLTVRGATLTSGSDTISAISPKAALDSGDVEQFGLNIVAAGGTGITVDTDYDNITPSADHYYYGGTASTADSIAVCGGLSDTTTYTIRYAANISGSTHAHTDYTASLTYVATGNF